MPPIAKLHRVTAVTVDKLTRRVIRTPLANSASTKDVAVFSKHAAEIGLDLDIEQVN